MAVTTIDSIQGTGVHSRLSALLYLAGIALMLASCAGPKVSTQSSPHLQNYKVRAVVVMPFENLSTPQIVSTEVPEMEAPQTVKRSDISIGIPGPGDRVDQQTVSVPPSTGMKVARIFSTKLSQRSDVLVYQPEEADRALRELALVETQGPSEEVAQRVANRLKADAALIGLVRVYKERVGGRYGADPGAVVGFEVKLIAQDGRVLWVGNYYEAQRPLTEDFGGFLARGFGFFTAKELASYGAEKLAQQFPVGAAPSVRPAKGERQQHE